jgi:hypothetical protein
MYQRLATYFVTQQGNYSQELPRALSQIISYFNCLYHCPKILKNILQQRARHHLVLPELATRN